VSVRQQGLSSYSAHANYLVILRAMQVRFGTSVALQAARCDPAYRARVRVTSIGWPIRRVQCKHLCLHKINPEPIREAPGVSGCRAKFIVQLGMRFHASNVQVVIQVRRLIMPVGPGEVNAGRPAADMAMPPHAS
jgi:hypothetical protein